MAYKSNNGHTAVALNAYLGDNPVNFSGDWGRLIVNAGRWLNCPNPCPQGLVATVNDSVTGTGINQWDYTSGGRFYYNNNSFTTAYQNDEHYAFATGVKAHFRFHGSQVKIYTVKEPAGGNIRYTLDNGVDVQIISNYSPTPGGEQFLLHESTG